jgi:hypothetical protein
MSIARVVSVAVLFATLSLSVPAQNVRITNMSALPRKQWVDVAIPAGDAVYLPLLCRLDPQGWIAVKGSQVGQHSTLFHVLSDLGGCQTVTGHLVAVSGDPNQVPVFAMTDWVADQITALLPTPAVLDRNGLEHRLTGASLTAVENAGPARQVFCLRGRIDGTPLVYESYIYVYSYQDAVKVEMTFTNSDPRTANLSYDFDLMWIESGEFLRVDWLRRLGLPNPVLQNTTPTHPSYGQWVQILSPTRTMGRGEQIHTTGWFLSLPQNPMPLQAMRYSAGGMQMDLAAGERLRTLLAVYDQPAAGVCLDWQGKWLAFGLTPELPPAAGDGWNDANQSAAAFSSLLQTPADLYSQRPRGLNQAAGTTGAQEDYGACKGAFAVTVGDPRYIPEMGYTVHGEMFLRGYHYREVDGTPLMARNHPGLQLWSQLLNCRTSQETFGLVCPTPFSWPNDGWSTFDDQHRSQNNFNALLALTGDWSLRATLRDLMEVDKVPVPNHMDSPRAEGRLFLAWANALLLLDDPLERQELANIVSQRIATIDNQWLGGQFVNNPAKPVRVLSIGSDPTFLDPQQNRIPAIVVWEHGIAALGLYASWRITGDQRIHDIAAEISKTVVNHCMFQDPTGHWLACTCVRYLQGTQEGDPLPSTSYYVGSPDIHIDPSVDFFPWIMPAVLACRDLWPGDQALVARCNAILQERVPNGPGDWDEAQWWAMLPR